MGWNFLGFHELDLSLNNGWEFPFGPLPVAPIDNFAIRVLYTNGIVIVNGQPRWPTITGLMGQFLKEPGPLPRYQVASRRLTFDEGQAAVFHFGPQGQTYDENTGQITPGSTIWTRDGAGNLQLRNDVQTWIGFKPVPKKRGVRPIAIPTPSGDLAVRYPWWYDLERSKFTVQIDYYEE